MMQETDQDDEQILFDQEGLLSSSGSSSSSPPIKRSSWKRKFIKTIVLCIAFFALGLCIAIPGPTLLDLGERVHANTEKISLIFTARSLGYLLGSIIGGFLFDRFDQQLLLFYTLIFTSIATAVAPWCTVLMVLAAMIALQGVSMGVLDTGGNVFCIKIWGKKSAPYMQLLHFAFGVGAFIAPLLARPFLINHELLSRTNTSLITRSYPYQGKAPVLYDISSHYEHLIKRSADDNLTLIDVDKLNVSTDYTTISSILHVLPKKPTVTDEKHSSGDDADGTKTSGVIRDEEKQKKTKQEDGNTKQDVNDNNIANVSLNGVNSNNTGSNSANTSISPSTTTTTQAPTTSTAQTPTTSTAQTPTTSTAQTPTTTQAPTTTTLAPTTTTQAPTTTTQEPTTTTQAPTTTTQAPTTTTQEPTTTTPVPTTTQAFTTMAPKTTVPPSNVKPTTKAKPTTTILISTTYNGTNTTEIHKKPDTASGDLINSAINALSNMSKIQFAYLIIGLLLAVNAFLFLMLYCKETYKDVATPQEEKENNLRKGTKTFRATTLSLLFIFFFVYVGMEVTYGGLLSTFAVENMNWTEQQGATVTAVFWGSVAAGRGIAIVVAKLCSPPCMLIVDLVLVILGAIILAFGTKANDMILWFGTLTLGLGMSSMFPTGISWADHYFPLTGKATAILIVGSALGEMLIPVITGYLYENETQMALMYMMLAMSTLSAIIYIIMQKVASNKRIALHVPSMNGFEQLKEDDDMPLDILEPSHTNGFTETTRSRQNKVQFKPESNGEYKRLIDFSDQEFS